MLLPYEWTISLNLSIFIDSGNHMREGKVVDAFYQLSNLQMVNNPQIRCDCGVISFETAQTTQKGAWNYLRTAPVFQLPCS